MVFESVTAGWTPTEDEFEMAAGERMNSSEDEYI